jgi:hypothetical protein
MTRYPSHAPRMMLTPLLGDRLAGAERGDLVGRVPELGHDLIGVTAPA